MKAAPYRSALRGIWAVAWRSLVLFPAALATTFLLVLLLATLVFSPLLAGLYFFLNEWGEGMASLAVWVFVVWAWRRFRLGRLYNSPAYL